MRLAIVTDSTCDLPPDLMQQAGISLVPIPIQFGSESYEEGVTLDRAGFYRRIEQLGIIPKTSQPAPARFAEVYRNLRSTADVVLSIHVTGQLSGTCQAAALAAEMVKDEISVHVFDSMAGSAGIGFMALEARQRADSGSSLDTIVERLIYIRQRLTVIFNIDTLRYAVMSGRISALRSTVASVLQIKPIVTLHAGKLQVSENVRTRRRAFERILDIAGENLGATPVKLAVVHANAPADAATLLQMARRRFSVQQDFVVDLATSIAVHLGPGTVGLIAYPL